VEPHARAELSHDVLRRVRDGEQEVALPAQVADEVARVPR
jgi:hypothetical protein